MFWNLPALPKSAHLADEGGLPICYGLPLGGPLGISLCFGILFVFCVLCFVCVLGFVLCASFVLYSQQLRNPWLIKSNHRIAVNIDHRHA